MRTLLSTVRMERLQPFHIARLQFVDATDFSCVLRKTREQLRKEGFEPSEEYLHEGILALKQYYAIALLDPLNMHAVSDTLDPFWHTHVLHTQAYMAFCDELVGRYMHHNPLDHDDHERVAGAALLYGYTIECCEKFFHYVNLEMYPLSLPERRLVCTHDNDRGISELTSFALLPIHPAMQGNAMYA